MKTDKIISKVFLTLGIVTIPVCFVAPWHILTAVAFFALSFCAYMDSFEDSKD